MTQTLSIALPQDTVYVSGTVNDVAVTWTQAENNKWWAIADRSDDDIYHVFISIVSISGQTTDTQFVLYYGLSNMITDRTQQDVINKTDKGFYNASDLNRVGAAMQYVQNRLIEIGYSISINPKINWFEYDIPTQNQMGAYISDLNILRNTFNVMSTTPNSPNDMNYLTYIEANNIEQILLDLDFLITNIMLSWFFSGELYSGEV